MLVGKLILKFLPFSLYHSIRSSYRNFKKKLHKPLSEEEFRKILSDILKIRPGDVVFVHSSFDKLNTSFSPQVLLNILIETVGENGTLLFPAWHFNYSAEEYLKMGKVFDVKKSPSALGLVSELARRNKNAKRSIHPTTSIVAIGSKAEYLTATHHLSVYPCGELSPLYKMIEFNAKIIGLGVKSEFLSFVHCPEDVLKDEFPYSTRKKTIYKCKVRDFWGNMHDIETLVPHPDIKFRNIPKYIKKHIPPEVAFDIKIHGNDFFLVDAKSFYNNVKRLSSIGMTIYI